MDTDILLRGVEEFCKLVLIHPGTTIFGIKGHRGFAIMCFVDNDFGFFHDCNDIGGRFQCIIAKQTKIQVVKLVCFFGGLS
jgi:hypothetical protein